MQERRRYARWQLKGPVRIKQADVVEDEVQAKGADIGVGGLSFLSEIRHPPQTALELIIDVLDEDRYIFTKGKVVWQKDEIKDDGQRHVKTGTSFENLRDADRERIFNYVFKFCRDELVNKWWQGLKPKTETEKRDR